MTGATLAPWMDWRVPGWCPYRCRSAWDTRRVAWHIKDVWRTVPVPAAPADRAWAELFMQLCRRDVAIGVLSCKSLLANCGGRLAVTLIDDGSLRPADRAAVDAQLPGCRWLYGKDPLAPDSALLAGRPDLAAQSRRAFVLNAKLLFPSAFARAQKVIIIDPDTVFFRAPEMLIDWMKNGREALYLHDFQRDDRDEAPPLLKRCLAGLAPRIAPGREWRLHHYYFNSGLLAYEPAQLDFGIADRLLGWTDALPEEYRSGPLRIWFGSWVIEQTAYMAMYAFLDPPARPFDRNYRIGVPDRSVFCHFLRDGLVEPSSLKLLRDFVASLR